MCCPQAPCQLRRSSSKRPVTVPKGCSISRLPTRPERVGQAAVLAGEEEQPRCSDPVGADDRDAGPLHVLVAVGVEVLGALDQPVGALEQPAHPGAGDQLDSVALVHGPVGAVDGGLGAVGAAPEAGGAQHTRVEGSVLLRSRSRWARATSASPGRCGPWPPCGPWRRAARAAWAGPRPAGRRCRWPVPTRPTPSPPARSRARAPRRRAASRRPRRRASAPGSPTAGCAASAPRTPPCRRRPRST